MSDEYWHFVEVEADGVPRLGYGDGREVKAGATYTVDVAPVVCKAGLHACRRIIDALGYVIGPCVACRVTLSGTVIHRDDKSAATQRHVLGLVDAATTAQILSEFTRWCALQVADLWQAPDLVRRYLENGDPLSRVDAYAAAVAATPRKGARSPGWYSARNAAWSATRRNAIYAPTLAARLTAWEAATAGAEDEMTFLAPGPQNIRDHAVRQAQNNHLAYRVQKALGMP